MWVRRCSPHSQLNTPRICALRYHWHPRDSQSGKMRDNQRCVDACPSCTTRTWLSSFVHTVCTPRGMQPGQIFVHIVHAVAALHVHITESLISEGSARADGPRSLRAPGPRAAAQGPRPPRLRAPKPPGAEPPSRSSEPPPPKPPGRRRPLQAPPTPGMPRRHAFWHTQISRFLKENKKVASSLVKDIREAFKNQ